MRNVNILLVGFYKILWDGLKAILDQKKGFQVIKEAAGGEETLRICQKQSVDLVILNANISEISSIELTQKLRSNFPDIKILVLATLQKDHHIRQLFQAGASGYLLKDSGREELLKAIHTIIAGSLYFSEEVTQTVMRRFIKKEEKKQRQKDPFSLTHREIEVLELIVREFTNQEVADKLSISIRTVESHRRNLLQKTGSRNTAGLVRYALEKKIID